jgi:hypothetical protein
MQSRASGYLRELRRLAASAYDGAVGQASDQMMGPRGSVAARHLIL